MPVRVLVVDDDDLSREVLALLLQGAGYAVETAESGDAALLHLQAAARSAAGCPSRSADAGHKRQANWRRRLRSSVRPCDSAARDECKRTGRRARTVRSMDFC